MPSGGKGFSEIEQGQEAGKSKVCGKAVPLECPQGQSLGTGEQSPTPLTPPASYPDNAYRLCGVTRISLGEGGMASWVLETLLIKSHTLKATSSSALTEIVTHFFNLSPPGWIDQDYLKS